jgi:hypothetical protein
MYFNKDYYKLFLINFLRSFGCVLFETLTSKVFKNYIEETEREKLNEYPEILVNILKRYLIIYLVQNIIKISNYENERCLVIEPAKRASAKELLNRANNIQEIKNEKLEFLSFEVKKKSYNNLIRRY